MVNYGQEEGLNASHTYIIRQDLKGYMWIGTDNGLFRFDGAVFKQYGQKEGLKNIDVLETLPLSTGETMIFPFLNDISVLKNGRILTARNDTELKKIEDSHSIKYRPVLFEDPTCSKVCILDFKSAKKMFIYEAGKVAEYGISIPPEKDTLFGNEFPQPMDYDFAGNLLLRKEDGIYNYNVNTKKLSFITPFSGDPLYQMEKLGEGVTAFFTRTKLLLYNNRENTFSAPHDLPNPIYWMTKINGMLWIAFANGGIDCFDLSRDPELKSPALFLKDYIISGAMTDRDGNAWLSTKNNGIFFMEKNSFASYLKLRVQNNEGYITSIAGNEENIVTGYNNGEIGLYRNGKLKKITLDDQKNDEIRNIALDKEGAYFVHNYAVFHLNFRTGIFDNIYKLVLGGAKQILLYGEHQILMCNSSTLTQYDLKTGKWEILFPERAYFTLPYDKDSIFVANFKDLYKLNVTTKQSKLFLEGYYFTDVKQVSDNFYIGTTNGTGIYLFDKQHIIRHISETDGLISDRIRSVDVENVNTWWVSTNSGLSRVHMERDKFSVNSFTVADGLPSEHVSACFIRNDTVFAGTAKGMAVLSVKDLMKQGNVIDKKVLINEFDINGKIYFEPSEKIDLLYPAGNLSIDLSFPDYTSRGHVSYRYKIEGLNDEWQTTTSSKILINALPPGKYKFIVYGVGSNGKLSRNSTDLSFEIMPGYWQTRWFSTLCIAILFIIILWIVNKATQRRRDKKLQETIYEKKIAELELQAIKAQINPHFIYNCLNSIQFLLYKKDYEQTENYLNVFAKMIRKTLHYSEKTFMPIYEEAEYLDLYLGMEKLRFKSDFGYTIHIADDVNRNWTIPSLVIQPFVENAIKHGMADIKDEKGNVTISFEYAAPYLSVTITDNGPGIGTHESLMHKTDSFGIRLLQKRIETFRQLFNTDITLHITDLSENGSRGTEIKLFLLQK